MENLPEPVNQQVFVINFSSEEIVVAASSPQVANYLRLYVAEVQQQIQETFQLSLGNIKSRGKTTVGVGRSRSQPPGARTLPQL